VFERKPVILRKRKREPCYQVLWQTARGTRNSEI